MAELEDNGWKTWPNAISAARALMALAIPPLVKRGRVKTAASVFTVAAATDWVDGHIAKTIPGQSSDIGKIIDPYIDKWLTLNAMAALARARSDKQVRAALAAIAGREIVVTIAKRSKARSTGAVESAAEAGRFSMFAQSAAILLLLAGVAKPNSLKAQTMSNGAVWLGVGASLASGWAYAADAIKARKGEHPM